MKWSEMTHDERDRLVHEKVMGWQPYPCPGPIERDPDPLNCISPQRGLWHCTLCYYLGCGDDSSFPHEAREDIPDYSTDLNDAWELLETTHADGKFDGFSLTGIYMPNGSKAYICRLNIHGKITEAAADTPQDAICVAALRVHGIEIDLAKR